MSLKGLGPLALIGAGKMGLALARGWLEAGLEPDRLSLVDPSPQPDTVQFAASKGVTLRPTPDQLNPHIVVLAVKPQIMAQVLPLVRPILSPNSLVLSIAAGVALKTLTEGLGTNRVIRAMPNTPAQIGKGITGAVAGEGVGAGERAAIEALMKASGAVLWFEREGDIDGVTAVSGSGPAYVFYLVEALAEAAEEQGFAPDAAMQLARQTVIGAASLMEADPSPAAQLRTNVTSPNGTTAAALAVLMGPEGLGPLMKRAVAAARARSEELGRG